MDAFSFVERCVACVARGGTAEEISQLVREALASQQADPSRWGGKELLHRSDDLFIVDLTLPPFATSAIHDHGTWAVIGISQGREVDYFYRREGAGLAPHGQEEVHGGNAIVLEPGVIHSIANPDAQPARGLHVYGCDLLRVKRRMWDPETVAESAMEFAIFEQWEKQLTSRSAKAGATVLPAVSPRSPTPPRSAVPPRSP